MKYQGTCSCGKVKVGILTEPLLSYNCHCSHCRAFASRYHGEEQPYQSAVMVWRWSVRTHGTILYEPSTGVGGLFAMQRGRCASCLDPVWEKGERFAAPYAMVMTKTLVNVVPDTNIYYNSGFQKGPTDVKVTIYSDLGSLLYEVWTVLTSGMWYLPASIVALIRANEFKND